MANTKSVGSLNIGVTVELAKMQAQFDEMQKRVKTLNTRLNSQFRAMSRGIQSALGAIGVSLAPAALIAFGKSVVDLGSNINDLSQTAGVNAQSFQALSLHFMDSGVSMEELSKAFVLLRKNTQEAASGNKTMQASFAALGIDAQKLQRLAPERQFEAMAMAIASATDQNKAFGAALDILGTKNAPKLMQSLKELGVQGLDKIAESTAKWRLSDEQLKTLDDAGDKLARMAKYAQLIGAQGILGAGKAIETPQLQGAVANAMGPLGGIASLGLWAGNRMAGGSAPDTSASALLAMGEAQDMKAALAARKRAAALAAIAPADFKEQGSLGLVASSLDANGSDIQATLDRLTTSYRTLEDSAKAAAAGLTVNFEALATNGQLTADQIEKQNELADSFRQMIDPTLIYQRQIATVNVLLEKGSLTTDEATRAIHELTDAMEAAKKNQINDELTKFFGDMDQQSNQHIEQLNKTKEVAIDMGFAFSSAFEDAIINGGEFSDVLRGIEKDIIRIALRASITEPMGKMLGAMFSGLFFADGGRPPVGQASMVGEQGPELFVPDSAGTIIPNSKIKAAGAAPGGGFVFHQSFSFGSGITRAEVASMLPGIVKAAKAAVADGVQRGGGFRKSMS